MTRLGLVAFGGPAAHTALMREEFVTRRGWVDDERFMDLVGATQLVPGPNSTELALHLGADRGGWRGMLLAGAGFIVPSAVLTTVLAAWYVEHGRTPALEGLLAGVVPVVLGVVVWAVLPLLRTVLKGPLTWLVLAGALVGYLLGFHEVALLAAGALAGVLGAVTTRPGSGHAAVAPWLLLAGWGARADATLVDLFWSMLRTGAVLFGSGYVLIALLEADVVDRFGWLTQTQLLDAVAVGQVTPGPLFTTATFVGYLVAGLPGAVLATVAIFLPSFVFVGLLTRITDRLRSSAWSAGLLDGVNAAALALLLGVGVLMGRDALTGVVPALLCAGTVAFLRWTRFGSGWCIALGAVVGLLGWV